MSVSVTAVADIEWTANCAEAGTLEAGEAPGAQT